MTLLFASADASRLVRLSTVDLVIIVFYFALVLAIGFYLKERSNTGEDFFMAGREMMSGIVCGRANKMMAKGKKSIRRHRK